MSTTVHTPSGSFECATEADAAAARAALRAAFRRGEEALGRCLDMVAKPGPSFPIVEHTDPPDPLGIKL